VRVMVKEEPANLVQDLWCGGQSLQGIAADAPTSTSLSTQSTHGLVGACIGVFTYAQGHFLEGHGDSGLGGKTWKADSEACGELCRLSGWCFIASFR
jgi:hypothetical protein